MEHWDQRDFADAKQARLPRRERERLRALFLQAPKPKRRKSDVQSLAGLALALGMLGLLAWALAPGAVVSSKLTN